MKEKLASLKARVKVCAQFSRAVTEERLREKATRTDKQSEEYRKMMEGIFFERQSSRWKGRVAHLAYGYARGVPYQVMEKTDDVLPYRAVATLLGLEDEMVIFEWMTSEVSSGEEAA